MKKIVIIPSDPLVEYERKGTSVWLEDYFNPCKHFDKVFILSPKETDHKSIYGLEIIPVKSVKDYRKKILAIEPDIVRAYGGYWACDYAIYNTPKKIPVLVSIHDTNLKLLHKSVIFSNYVICMSNAVQKLVTNFGVDKKYTEILGNRVNIDWFSPKKNPEQIERIKKKYNNKKIILHIGRKTKQKNIETVVHALKYLTSEYISIFIGQGNSQNYKKIARDLGVNERCFWIESIPNTELVNWYNASEIFCVPSRWEGFGLVFIEAAASGCAIITSNIAPMNELLSNKKNAILIDKYEDPMVLSKTINILETDNDLKSSIRAEAIKVAKKFDKTNIDKKEVSIYKNMIRHRKSKRKGLKFEYIRLKFRLNG